MVDVRELIQRTADVSYNGSYRFFKKKNLVSLIGIDAYNDMIDNMDLSLHVPVSKMIYCYMNHIYTEPMCVCGNSVKFNTSTKQFMTYCSNACRIKNFNETISNRQKTCIERYGRTNYLASDEGRNKIKETNMSKYGVDNYTKSAEYKEKYSGSSRLTIEGKLSIANKLRKRNYDSLPSKYPSFIPLFSFEEYGGVKGYKQYPWHCKECKKSFYSSCDNGASPECPNCKPSGSDLELKIKEFLDYYNIEYKFRYRGLPSGREVDLYIPSKNIGIELHGLYWHSTARNNYTKNDHISKLKECEFEGIRLISIYADEIYHKFDIVRNRLRNILGLTRYSIYARKCQIREVSCSDSAKFLEKYHIQGQLGSSYSYGLYYKNRLVSLMTFNKGRMATGNSNMVGVYELGRYCTLSAFNIVGGAGKLLKHFIRTHNPSEIYSYADRRWSEGNLYNKLGMDFIKNTVPNYFYTKDFKSRLHRIKFQKNKLIDMPSYSKEKTEYSIMEEEGYYRTWDCGNKKFQMVL